MPMTVLCDHGPAPRPSVVSSATSRLLRFAIALSLLAAVGCQDYRWRWDYQAAEAQAREQGKDLFIFYKWWLNDDSNRMHDMLLKSPEVGALLQDTVNLLLEKDSSTEQAPYSQYVTKFGVNTTPAFVLVKPDGSYRVEVGYIPKDRFIEFIKKAKAGTSPNTPRAAPRTPTGSSTRQP
jgi:hypothetical protein